MSISLDSRIWLAAHLLYPNSSQAFDVYQTLVMQSESSIKKNNVNSIFQKLYQIGAKIPAISSNKAFHVFDEDKIEQWRQIYRKSQKDQLIIFVGYFVFGLSLKDIAGMIKISFEKTQFLFHQTFKKSVLSNIKIDVADKVQFKKYNEEKVSFLFTNENLIDYCLKTLNPTDMKKVKVGLEMYPELKASEKQFNLIANQMYYLVESQVERVTKTLIQTSETLSEPREAFQMTKLFVRNKVLVGAIAMSAVVLFLVTLRPQWIQSLNKASKDHYVDLQEIKPQHVEVVEASNETTTATEKPLVVEPSKDLTHAVVALKASTTTPIAAKAVPTTTPVVAGATPPKTTSTPVVAPAKPVTPAKPVVVAKHGEDISSGEPKKLGGLYRGVLTVTDLNEVSDKITQRLVDIGGKKAGEVELGWRKTDKLAYYHFTLPENNIDTMKEFLSNFGTLQIQYENHPRLMPAGVKRLIIEVKERE